jgi:hypothetical protein
MLDSLAPFVEKNNKNISSLNKSSSSAVSNINSLGADGPLRNRLPSYENSNAVKGTDGVIYRAAGARGKGAKNATVPIVAPTVVAPGCVTTATLEPMPMVKPEKVKPELLSNGFHNIKKEVNTFTGSVVPGFGNNIGQFNSALDDIRAKFPMANSPRTKAVVNNNVIKQVEKKMQDPWENPKTKELKTEPVLTSPESGNRLLYDPKRRRGRPLDIPDQTIILATPKLENSPTGFKQV